MSQNNTCPNCGETSESGWDTCWNCQAKLSPTDPSAEPEKKNTPNNNDLLVMVDGKKIISAGKQIKLSVILHIISLIIGLIGYIVVSITDNNGYYAWVIGINIGIYIGIIINIFQAGRDLIKSIPVKK